MCVPKRPMHIWGHKGEEKRRRVLGQVRTCIQHVWEVSDKCQCLIDNFVEISVLHRLAEALENSRTQRDTINLKALHHF